MLYRVTWWTLTIISYSCIGALLMLTSIDLQ
jgi:hypothetical protein